jgi:hypothetical protein
MQMTLISLMGADFFYILIREYLRRRSASSAFH